MNLFDLNSINRTFDKTSIKKVLPRYNSLHRMTDFLTDALESAWRTKLDDVVDSRLPKNVAAKKDAGVVSPNYELEVRFGRFDSERSDRCYHGGITVNAYQRLLERHKTNFASFTVDSEHVLCPDDALSNVTVHIDEERRVAIRKHKISTVDVSMWAFKIQATEEAILDSIQYTELLASIRTEHCVRRKRKRTSFWLIPDLWRLDLTYVETLEPGNSCSTPSWEAELEYTGFLHFTDPEKHVPAKSISATMVQIVHSLLQIIQDSFFPMHVSTFQMLENMMQSKRQTLPHFAAVQPRAMARSDLNEKTFTESAPYAMTLKADGERALMFIAPEGHAYLFTAIDKWRELPRFDAKWTTVDYAFTMIDGEYDGHRFHAFDLISIGGNILCEGYNKAPNLLERVRMLNHVRTECGGIFDVKEYLTVTSLENVTAAADKLLNQAETLGPFTIDGIIFTPINELPTYRTKTWAPQMKWKMKPTIDAMFSPDPADTALFAAAPKRNVSGNDDDSRSPRGLDHLIKFNMVEANLYPGQIAEFGWHKNQLRFVRLRPDKATPNFISVAVDIMKSYRDPITRCMITGKTVLLPSVPVVPSISKKAVSSTRQQQPVSSSVLNKKRKT